MYLISSWCFIQCSIYTFTGAVDIIPQSLRCNVAAPSRGKRPAVSLLSGCGRALRGWLLSQNKFPVYYHINPACVQVFLHENITIHYFNMDVQPAGDNILLCLTLTPVG